MNTADLVEWQRIDPINGLVEPWLTHPFMDFVKTWNMKNVTMLETGGGRSTAWWRDKCFFVDTIEANEKWGQQIEADCVQRGLTNGRLFCKTIPDGTPEGMKEYFSLIPPKEMLYNIIVIDGIYRTEMMQWAVDYFKENGSGIIIADNWQQDFVWISPKAEEIMQPYDMRQFIQPDHTNHEGRPWNTCYWIVG